MKKSQPEEKTPDELALMTRKELKESQDRYGFLHQKRTRQKIVFPCTRFCLSCGNRFVVEEDIIAASKHRRCPNCLGGAVKPPKGYHFCVRCGTKFSLPPNPRSNSIATCERHRKKWS